MRNFLYFPDLVVAHVIMLNCSDNRGVLVTKVAELGNQWLKDNKVPSRYAAGFASVSALDQTMKLLRQAKLIEHVGSRQGFRTTPKAGRLFGQIGMNWKEWFVSAPIDGEQIQLEDARYDKDFRTNL